MKSSLLTGEHESTIDDHCSDSRAFHEGQVCARDDGRCSCPKETFFNIGDQAVIESD